MTGDPQDSLSLRSELGVVAHLCDPAFRVRFMPIDRYNLSWNPEALALRLGEKQFYGEPLTVIDAETMHLSAISVSLI